MSFNKITHYDMTGGAERKLLEMQAFETIALWICSYRNYPEYKKLAEQDDFCLVLKKRLLNDIEIFTKDLKCQAKIHLDNNCINNNTVINFKAKNHYKK